MGHRGGWMSDVSDAAIVDLVGEAGAPDGRMVTGRFLIVTLATFAYFLALGLTAADPSSLRRGRARRERLRGRARRRCVRGVGGAHPAVGGPLRRPVRPTHPAQRRRPPRRARHPRLHPGGRHPRARRAPAPHGHRRGGRVRRRGHRHAGHGAIAPARRGGVVLQRGALQRARPRAGARRAPRRHGRLPPRVDRGRWRLPARRAARPGHAARRRRPTHPDRRRCSTPRRSARASC